MAIKYKHIVSLLEFVKVDKKSVICHFKCKVKNKTIISTVPFEPYDGKIIITFYDLIRHPLESYDRYYHTPITIYSNDCYETIVLKAFKQVSNKFDWNHEEQKYIYR
jgi:hypothetical protein